MPMRDTIETEYKFLTKGDPYLIAWLYKDIKAKKLQAYTTDKTIYPDLHNLLDTQKVDEYKNPPVLVPILDSTGETIRTDSVDLGIEPILYHIYNFTLVQDFYFDFTKEKLYSKLVALVPRMFVYTSTGKLIGFTDYWGVIFPAEKKKIANRKN